MAIDFPSSPTIGQEHASGGVVYVWNGTGWTVKGGSTSDFVKKAGDVMSGDLSITKDAPILSLDKSGTTAPQLFGKKSGLGRWRIVLGDAAVETGSPPNSGSLFHLQRYNDAGAFVDSVIKADRATGVIDFAVPPTVASVSIPIPAAPLDAMAYSGIQINGGCDVDQELKGLVSVNAVYMCEGWQINISGAATYSATRIADTTAFPGFVGYIRSGAVVANASPAATDFAGINIHIEGNKTTRLRWGTAGAVPLTLGFWTRHAKAGIYSVAIRNPPSRDRSYVTSYTQNVANAAEYKVITIPGCTDGVWAVDNTQGIMITFAHVAGSANTTPTPDAWVVGSFNHVASQINGAAATTDYMNLTGLIMLPGTQAPTAQQLPFIMRPFAQELLLCQRYFWKTFSYATIVRQASLDGAGALVFVTQQAGAGPWNAVHVRYPVEIRASPSVTFYNPFSANNLWFNTNRAGDSGAPAITSNGTSGFTVAVGQVAADLINQTLTIHAAADARL